jgi:transposase
MTVLIGCSSDIIQSNFAEEPGQCMRVLTSLRIKRDSGQCALSRARHKAHTRRKFHEVAEACASPIATEALRRISELYRIEEKISGQSDQCRREIRSAESAPLTRALKIWLDQQLVQIPERNPLADAIRYALGHWTQLTRFIDDGRIELDTNPVERAIRPVALGRKNHLFAGSDGGGARWATLCSLIETCKLNGVEPYAYLKDVLERMVDGYPANRINELLPWAWKAYATTSV